MLQSTKLKPVILGVGPRGIMRVDPKTKEVLDTWDYQVLRNWAYSRKTFVLVREVELLAIQHSCLSPSFSVISYPLLRAHSLSSPPPFPPGIHG